MAKELQSVSVFEGLDVTGDDVFLDVGCGGGSNCATAATVGADVIAMDIIAAHVDAATRAVEGKGARSYRGIVTDCDPIPLPDAAASVIVCSEVLEHVPDPARFVSELVRVGKPGARYALSVPAEPSEELMKVLAPPYYFEAPNHVRIFGRGEFEGLIRSAGLEIDRSEGLGYYWSIWWALRMASGTTHDPNSPTPPPPILTGWEATWKALLATPLGPRVARVLDDLIPKSVLVIARKPAAIPKPHVAVSGRVLAR